MVQNSNPPTQDPTFPAGAVVADTYWSILANLGYAWRLCWAWIVVTAAALVATDLLLGGVFAGKAHRVGIADWSSFAIILLYTLPIASIAVGWHRWLLLEEKDTSRVYLRLDGLVFSYFGYALLVQFIAWSPYFVPWLLRQFFKLISVVFLGLSYGRDSAIDYALSDKGLLASPIMRVVAVVALVILMTRLGVALPAKAIGVRGLSLKTAWEATKGQTFGLAMGLVLSVFPIALAFAGLRLAGLHFSAVDGSLLHVIDRLTFVFFETLLGLVQVAFLSYSFLFFFPPEGAAAAGPTN